jgi:Fur family ferric uptake transcriptional regulator
MVCMQPRDEERLAGILKDHGYSMTKARLFVCKLLWDQEPQTMHDLVEQLHGRIDRASLYRTIQLFEELGIVHRIYMGWKYKVELSDVLTHHHHHISCIGCGTVIAISDEKHIEQLIQSIAAKYNVVPTSHLLEIQGHCTACAKKDPVDS